MSRYRHQSALASCVVAQVMLVVTPALADGNAPIYAVKEIPPAYTLVQGHEAHASLSLSPEVAKVTFTVGEYHQLASGHLEVWALHKLVYDRPITNTPTSLAILRNPQTPYPLVLLETFSGGAHCCLSSTIIEPGENSDQTYVSEGDWGNTGVRVKQATKGGEYLFFTYDNALAYAFSSYAGSAFPIKVFAYRGHHLVDVTAEHPSLLRQDATKHWREYLTETREGTAAHSALVAYLADELRLGNGEAAWRRVQDMLGSQEGDFYQSAHEWLAKNGYER